MRAVVLGEQGATLRRDYPEPVAGVDEVRVRVLEAGICGTDLQLVAGYHEFRGVLGHEFVGVAETGRLAGRRVVGEINCRCGNCRWCREGLGNHCVDRSVLGILGRDGAFAEWLVLPEDNLHAVPEEISNRVAVFTEPLAAALQVLEQVPLSGGEQVVVLGDGRLGNLCAQALQRAGGRVRVIGRHDEKLAVCDELGLATCRLDLATPDHQADIVVDATGSPDGLPTALGFVRPRGTVVLKSTLAGEPTLPLTSVVIDEVTIVGSRCGPFDRALQALAAGEIAVAPLVSEVVPLDLAPQALEQAATDRTLLKTILEITP